MSEIQKKIELLQKIAHRFNEANIEWALGASMLLYFKGIISDYFTFHPQVSNFVNRHVYKTSMNPSWDDISGVLKSFDDAWKLQFKQRSKEENKSALNSLVDARNKVAHGGNMNHSFNEILQYYNRAWEIIVILDNIVKSEDHV